MPDLRTSDVLEFNPDIARIRTAITQAMAYLEVIKDRSDADNRTAQYLRNVLQPLTAQLTGFPLPSYRYLDTYNHCLKILGGDATVLKDIRYLLSTERYRNRVLLEEIRELRGDNSLPPQVQEVANELGELQDIPEEEDEAQWDDDVDEADRPLRVVDTFANYDQRTGEVRVTVRG
jgi:hypothetical protein